MVSQSKSEATHWQPIDGEALKPPYKSAGNPERSVLPHVKVTEVDGVELGTGGDVMVALGAVKWQSRGQYLRRDLMRRVPLVNLTYRGGMDSLAQRDSEDKM